MPWKECSVMDERLQFVARRLAGEAMAELCREFGISRKTGYKIFDRYQDCGVQGLTDRSRRPYRYAHQLPFQVENFILNVKREHTTWGARKIRERLMRRFSGIKILAKSTIHAVLDRHSKTPNGIAEVPLTPLAVQAFKDQLAISGPGPFLFPSDLNPKGHQRSLKTAWRKTLRRACVPYFRIYDLRSTYATRLSAGGVADEWVTQLLRQGDAQVFKRYSQMKLQMKREALEKINRQANEMPLDGAVGFGTGMVQ
jgi:transposase